MADDDFALPSDADAAPQAAASPASSSAVRAASPDTEFTLPSDADPSWKDTAADVAKQIPSGIALGVEALPSVIPSAMVAAGHGVDWALEKLGLQTPAMKEEAQQIENRRAAMEAIRPKLSDVLPVPTTKAGEYARTAGEFVPAAVTAAPGSIARVVTQGLIPGIASEAAGQATKDTALEPWARGAAAIAAGTVPQAVTAGASSAVQSLAKPLIRPLTKGGQETMAGQILASRAADIDALRTSLEKPQELIPGSQPTTFQLTGDMGLGALEREVATKNPQDFMQRRAEQNAARTSQLANLQPIGNPQDVTEAVRGQLNDIDQMTQTAVDGRLGEAQARAEGLGGQQGQEVYGNTIRTILQDAENQAREHERSLWNAVDPDGDLTVNMAPVRNVANDFYGNLSQAAQATLSPAERQILSVVGEYGPIEPFRELTDLRSLVSSEMRQELSTNGRSPAYGRLSQLRSGIEDSINSAVGNRAVADAVNVAAGRLSPEQSLAANIQRQIAEWQSGRQNAATGVGQASAEPATPVPSISGRSSAPRRGPPDATGNQGVQAFTANFDQAAADRLRAATTATRERAQTFNAQPIKGVLRRHGAQGPYNLLESAVPNKIFHPGDTGFDDVSRYRAAVGDEAALPILHDYAASSLREAALTPEGRIDPAKFARWQAQHSEALRAFPELSARFHDAASASEAVGDMVRLRNEALQQAQEGILGRIMNLRDPQDITRNIGAIFGSKNAVSDMRRLVAQIRNNPDAIDGLRKTVADYINHKFITNAEAAASGKTLISSDQFQSFVKNNAPVLSQIFTPEQMNSLKAIAADLQRSNRSLTAVRIPGQSNTPQDLAAINKNQIGQSLLRRVLSEVGTSGAVLAVLHNPMVAAAAGFGTHVINAFRTAGFKNVDDLVKQAMLDPALAKTLLSKVTAPASDRVLARRVTLAAKRAAALTAASINRQQARGRSAQQGLGATQNAASEQGVPGPPQQQKHGGRIGEHRKANERAHGGTVSGGGKVMADSCQAQHGDMPEHQQLSDWERGGSISPAIGRTDPVGHRNRDEVPEMAGGGQVPSRPFHPRDIGARLAKDGRWYVEDKARPGKYLRVEKRTHGAAA